MTKKTKTRGRAKRTKQIGVPMKFNSGILGYQPDLSAIKKIGRTVKMSK